VLTCAPDHCCGLGESDLGGLPRMARDFRIDGERDAAGKP
jgi:hypothetical protein